MDFSNYFPFWKDLNEEQQKQLSSAAVQRTVKKNTLFYHGGTDCLGLILVESGQLRAYMLSESGQEITLYRLFEYDSCLFSASCIIHSLQFDLSIEAEKDTTVWIIPPDLFKKISEESLAVSTYVNQLMASRFSEVIWLIEQILWKSFDKRLASFLLEESAVENADVLKITHEKIAKHLGTAREVVTRMLRYFQSEGLVKLSRGTIEILDSARLYQFTEN